uniref:Uncharacterized protein n=1 Tax=Arundo donax TaxID=35708 RepID=A0A0A9F607_ARUDO
MCTTCSHFIYLRRFGLHICLTHLCGIFVFCCPRV